MRPVSERQWHPFAGAMRFVDRQDHLQRPPRPVAAAQRLAVLGRSGEQVGDNQIVQRMLLWRILWGARWGPFGPAEAVAARIAEYAGAGADTVVVRFASFQPERQLATFLEKVAPAFA